MVTRFNLESTGEGRGGRDALLRLHPDGLDVKFELKSTDGDSISTARDVGREHIDKWRQQHWLFGFYRRGSHNPPRAVEYIYASPRQLGPWIDEQEDYVVVDWALVEHLPKMVDLDLLHRTVGAKYEYTFADARKILKSQKLEQGEHVTGELRRMLAEKGLAEPRRFTAPLYRALMDRDDGFSPEMMLTLLQERCRYLLDRGSTRNNPHIPQTRLRVLVPSDQVVPGDHGDFAARGCGRACAASSIR